MDDGCVSEYIIRRAKNSFLEIYNKVQMQFCRDIFMGHRKEKTKKYSIIVLKNGIHPLHMIYYRISLLIQLGVCY